ncbi:MAG: PAS domain S-box protein [Syntrophales bacterium]|nr:PAS domain S-box protein [Syntrophales bacterium]MDD5531723.1 PAS domain S-box protein [Syntrophales bacterium]
MAGKKPGKTFRGREKDEWKDRLDSALREIDLQFRNLVGNLPIGIYRATAGRDERMLMANPAIAEMFGYGSVEDFILNCRSMLHVSPSVRKRFSRKLRENGFVNREEIELYGKDGKVFWGSISAKLIRSSGRNMYVDGFIEDITGRKQAETALSVSESRLRALMEGARDIIFIKDENLRYILVNPSAVAFFQKPADQIVGRTDRDLLSEDWAGPGLKTDREVLKGRVVESEVTTDVHGIVRTLHSIKVPLRDQHGRVKGLCGISRDITDRKLTEKMLEDYRCRLEELVRERTAELDRACRSLKTETRRREKAQKELRESEERFRSIYENSLEGILLVNTKGGILAANPAACRMFGMEEEEMLRGRKMRVRGKGPKLDRFFRLKADEKRGEVEQFRKDGTRFVADVSSGTFTTKDGEKQAVVILRDVTERRLAREELKKSRERLRALAAGIETVREEERTRIARELHDELGQVLTGLKMDVSWIQKRLSPGEKLLRDKMQFMLEYLNPAVQMVRRISTELRPGILDDLGLKEAMEWQIRDFENRTGIRVALRSNMGENRLQGDVSTALFRILQESLTNIIRHAGATEVGIDIEQKKNSISLRVRDNGRGISKRRSEARNSIGIAGMRERAELAGGEFRITGSRGKGTEIFVEIPLVKSRE